jgi:hypothetical protein
MEAGGSSIRCASTLKALLQEQMVTISFIALALMLEADL